MKKLLIILAYSIYLFVLIGLIFHTSIHPQILGRYTGNYFLFLLFLILVFPIFIATTVYIQKTSTLKLGNKKIMLNSTRKFILLILMFVFLILIPAEFFLRHKYKGYESNAYISSIDNFHPFLQYQMKPGGESFPVNSDNFRGGEIKKKSKDSFRIVIFGGSTLLQRNLPENETTAELLKEKLSQKYPTKKIEVINAGFDGYTTEHSLIEYLFKVKDMNPDLVIMWHGINDLYYSCITADRAYGEYKNDYSHYYSADGRMVLQYFNLPHPIRFKFLSYDFFKKFLQDNMYSDIKDMYKRKHPYPDIYTRVPISKQYEMQNPSLNAYSRNIKSFIEVTKSDGIPVILGDQANLYKGKYTGNELSALWMPKEFCTKNNKIPTVNSFKNSMDSFNKETKKIAEENNVTYVELDSMPKNLKYFVDDVHYTSLGSKFIADKLFDKIVSEDLIK